MEDSTEPTISTGQVTSSEDVAASDPESISIQISVPLSCLKVLLEHPWKKKSDGEQGKELDPAKDTAEDDSSASESADSCDEADGNEKTIKVPKSAKASKGSKIALQSTNVNQGKDKNPFAELSQVMEKLDFESIAKDMFAPLFQGFLQRSGGYGGESSGAGKSEGVVEGNVESSGDGDGKEGPKLD